MSSEDKSGQKRKMRENSDEYDDSYGLCDKQFEPGAEMSEQVGSQAQNKARDERTSRKANLPTYAEARASLPTHIFGEDLTHALAMRESGLDGVRGPRGPEKPQVVQDTRIFAGDELAAAELARYLAVRERNDERELQEEDELLARREQGESIESAASSSDNPARGTDAWIEKRRVALELHMIMRGFKKESL